MKLAKFIVLCALYKKVGYFLNRPHILGINKTKIKIKQVVTSIFLVGDFLKSIVCFLFVFFSTKEHVESVAYTHRNSTVSNHSDVERGNSLPASDAGSSSHHPTATLTNTNHTEEKRPHSQCNEL